MPDFRTKLSGFLLYIRPSILDIYIFKEILPVFFVWLVFFTSLFMSLVLKDVAGELLGKGVDPLRVFQYIGYLIGEKLTQTIPMASLLSGIMAAGRLSGDSEIVAMRSAGISYPRMYAVFIFFGVVAGSVVAVMNLYFGPLSSRSREDFEEWVKAYHSLTLVQPGRFLGSAQMDGVTKSGQDIYAESRAGQALYRVQIRQWINELDQNKSDVIHVKGLNIPIGNGYMTQIVHAGKGEMLSRMNPDGQEEKFLRFKDGFMINVTEDQKEIAITDFKDGFMDYVIPPPVKTMGRLNVKPDNYTFPELFDFLYKLDMGGHQIDLCSIMPDCETLSSNQKVGELSQEGTVFTLPSYSQMELMVTQLQMWIFKEGRNAGKPGGPTSEEVQTKMQLWIQFSAFIKDAEKTRIRFEVEIHKRLALPVATVLFFFISFPLGLIVKRSGKGMGFALALGVFVIFYIFLGLGLSQAYAGAIPPFLGAWIPDIVVALLGVYVMVSRTEGFGTARKKIMKYYPQSLHDRIAPVISIPVNVVMNAVMRFIKKRQNS
jgi:lipopolysaccharide export system permease protein